MRVYAPMELTKGVHQIRYRFTANPRENNKPGTESQVLGIMGDKGFEPLAADLYSIKMLALIIALLHQRSVHVYPYLDDMLIVAQ